MTPARTSRPLSQLALAVALPVLIAVSVAAPRASAQSLYGSIVGTVTDATDAPVPGATVTVVQTQTNQTRVTVTSYAGVSQFPRCRAAPTPSPSAWEDSRRSRGATSRSASATWCAIDAKLQVSAGARFVYVSAQATTLQTDGAEVQSQLTTRSLEELPVPPNRNYQNFFVTIPGFTPPSNAHSISANPSRALQFNVNGATRNSNAVRIEGAAAPNVWLPHVAAYVPGSRRSKASALSRAASTPIRGWPAARRSTSR